MSSGVTLEIEEFGVLLDDAGQSVSVQRFTWKTGAGLKLSVINLDAAIIELCVPDRTLQFDRSENILLGVDTLEEYLQLDPTLVCAAQFEGSVRDRAAQDSKEKSRKEPGVVDRKRVWHPFVDGSRLHLSLEQSIIATVTITVEPTNVVRIQYRTSCATGGLCRLAHRFLLNLAGRDAGPAGTYEHVVQLNSDRYIDNRRVLRHVSETLADLRIAQHLGLILYNARNESRGSQGKTLCGIYTVNNASQEGFAARLIHIGTGRAMELYCNFPWLCFSTMSQLPAGRDQLVPFYPRQGLRRVSLVFDIERFVMSIVDVLEKESQEDTEQHAVCVEDNKEEQPKDQDAKGRFFRDAGLLLFPISCPFKVLPFPYKRRQIPTEASGAQPNGASQSPVTFVGHVTLKFGICKDPA
ncbi:AGAP008154-PA-like protein [Anopheles sinensis]|uniref:AGAP008154-PA-like protein n=1 Tax=Anopheles sinensis TaxID=74873 RepID=A0A084W847_ANOSI|nr:AGAP008154-PA-like protein [Anopheles sinensis]